MSTYEVHAGSWRQGLSYRELADELIDYVVAAGFTHLEFMPLAEHPEWFKRAVFYEVLVRGFADSNADGVGDLRA